MDLLDRLYQRLWDAASRAHPDARLPLTIADVYQHLTPYRAVRGELGLMELAQYEHTLLRLLSGERGYVRVEDPEVERELRRELASTNPILGIYRDYAGVGVEVREAEVAAPPASAPPEAAPPPLETPREESVARPTTEPAATEPAATEPCRGCGESLPQVEGLRFCPACGADQQEVPCAACGTPLRAEWNFCIRCGRPRRDRPPPA